MRIFHPDIAVEDGGIEKKIMLRFPVRKYAYLQHAASTVCREGCETNPKLQLVVRVSADAHGPSHEGQTRGKIIIVVNAKDSIIPRDLRKEEDQTRETPRHSFIHRLT